ncbi:hypothetical protein D9M72_294470 [compost metagenome]
MAAGLDALGNNGIDACCFHPTSLFQAGGAGQQADTGRLERIDPVAGRQAEMEADHGRTFVQQHLQHFRVGEEALVDLADAGRRLGAELGEQRPQVFQPGGFALGVSHGRAVAEQVDVERAAGQCPGLGQHGSGLGRRAGTDADGAQGAGIGHGSREGRGGNTHHGRLDDGVFDVEQSGDGHGAATPQCVNSWPIYLK